ncbi:MAG: branched-chain amino acid ABC transporter permease [Desulfarculus sp.]|nr:branched-chain amino acid ABC transporter permease [Desulfarculus sp.]
MNGGGRAFLWQLLALALAVAGAPLLVGNPYHLNVLNVMALNVLVVTGLNLLIGFAGHISLGHAAFYGLGAYVSGILSSTHGWDPWLSTLAAALLVALVALLIGIPTLRLAGNYLVMATLGFNLIITILILQLDEFTGGPSGFSGIPPLKVLGHSLASDQQFYWLVWTAALLGLLLARNLADSRVGRGLKALHDSPVAAAAVGVPTAAYKVKVFVLSAVYASLAGSLYAHYFGIVTPKTFDIFFSVELVTMCLVGGMGSLWGGFFGAAFLTPLPQVLHVFDEYKDVFFGGILLLLLIFQPQGLAGLWARRSRARAARSA